MLKWGAFRIAHKAASNSSSCLHLGFLISS